MNNFWELFGQGVLYAGFPVAVLTMALGFIAGKIKQAGILAIVAIPIGGFLGLLGVLPFFVGVSYYFFKEKIHGKSNKYNDSYVKELEELSNLKERGILTEDEFLTKKNEILNHESNQDLKRQINSTKDIVDTVELLQKVVDDQLGGCRLMS